MESNATHDGDETSILDTEVYRLNIMRNPSTHRHVVELYMNFGLHRHAHEDV